MHPVPSPPALTFALDLKLSAISELPQSASRGARDFGASLVRFRYDLPGCSPTSDVSDRVSPAQETFTSRLSTIRSPSLSLDITTAATGQFPPVGLSPTRTAASFAAPDPNVHVDALGSSTRTTDADAGFHGRDNRGSTCWRGCQRSRDLRRSKGASALRWIPYMAIWVSSAYLRENGSLDRFLFRFRGP